MYRFHILHFLRILFLISCEFLFSFLSSSSFSFSIPCLPPISHFSLLLLLIFLFSSSFLFSPPSSFYFLFLLLSFFSSSASFTFFSPSFFRPPLSALSSYHIPPPSHTSHPLFSSFCFLASYFSFSFFSSNSFIIRRLLFILVHYCLFLYAFPYPCLPLPSSPTSIPHPHFSCSDFIFTMKV